MMTWIFGAIAILAGVLLARMIYQRQQTKKRLAELSKMAGSAVAGAPYERGPAVDPIPCVASAPLTGVDCAPPSVEMYPGSYATYGMYNTGCYGNTCSARNRACSN